MAGGDVLWCLVEVNILEHKVRHETGAVRRRELVQTLDLFVGSCGGHHISDNF